MGIVLALFGGFPLPGFSIERPFRLRVLPVCSLNCVNFGCTIPCARVSSGISTASKSPTGLRGLGVAVSL